MVKRSKKITKVSKAKYKKCLLTAIRRTKIVSRKGAAKAFKHAVKKCNALITGVPTTCSKPRRKTKKTAKRKTKRVSRDPFKLGNVSKPRRKVSRRPHMGGIPYMTRSRGSGRGIRHSVGNDGMLDIIA